MTIALIAYVSIGCALGLLVMAAEIWDPVTASWRESAGRVLGATTMWPFLMLHAAILWAKR